VRTVTATDHLLHLLSNGIGRLAPEEAAKKLQLGKVVVATLLRQEAADVDAWAAQQLSMDDDAR
jgi:hypothetical protein